MRRVARALTRTELDPRLPPESILLRWFNFHLKAAGSARTVSNFSGDLMNSECYTVLLGQVSAAGPCRRVAGC